jgi:hypothetical protein
VSIDSLAPLLSFGNHRLSPWFFLLLPLRSILRCPLGTHNGFAASGQNPFTLCQMSVVDAIMLALPTHPTHADRDAAIPSEEEPPTAPTACITSFRLHMRLGRWPRIGTDAFDVSTWQLWSLGFLGWVATNPASCQPVAFVITRPPRLPSSPPKIRVASHLHFGHLLKFRPLI